VAAFCAAATLLAALAAAFPSGRSADADTYEIRSTATGSDGRTYTVTNHLVADTRTAEYRRIRREYLLVWAGADQAGTPDAPNPDFIAVIDATRGTPGYGRVVNTATLDDALGNEPHHMQYTWHKGHRIYAGGLLSDTTFVFDVSKLPQIRLSGVAQPADTPCGSAPDAFWVLRDGTAYGTNMGGPDVAGPCRYSNGDVVVGNGFGGTPGQVVRYGPDGRVLAQVRAADLAGEDPKLCPSVPALPKASCANPHGVQVREDLDRMITSDFVEVRNLLPTDPPPTDFDPNLLRDTVRVYDIADRGDPELLSVSRLPVGPRRDADPMTAEPRGAMEVAVTNKPRHRGAFASTSGGGAVYYTPDITDPSPRWREVYDLTSVFTALYPTGTPTAGASGAGWMQVSPDDRYLFHVVVGAGPGTPDSDRVPGTLYVLDLHKLLAAGPDVQCSIDTLAEVRQGGAEPDCPALAGALPIADVTSGGPHWGALDNFTLGADRRYHETERITRVATSNYFVQITGVDGNHQVCMALVDHRGRLTQDTRFVDEAKRTPCVDFNRARWPHGEHGHARPHGLVFAVADADLR
jgi:hypothetical protein